MRCLKLQKTHQTIQSRFGFGKVLFFREVDCMLSIQLENPAYARVYLTIDDCLKFENKLITFSEQCMEHEDILRNNYAAMERSLIKIEIESFAKEDNAAKILRKDNQTKKLEDLKKERIIENAQQDLQMFLKSEAGRTELKNKVEYLYEQEENRRLNVARKWNGLGQRPKPLQIWEKLPLHQKLSHDVKNSMLQGFLANKVHQDNQNQVFEDRAKIFEFTFNNLLCSYIKSTMGHTYHEEINTDKMSKEIAEKLSGVIFHLGGNLSHDAYLSMLNA